MYKNINIVKLVIQETGTYNTQFRRPYETTLDREIVDVLTERVSRSGSDEITGSTVTGIASSMVKPTAAPQSVISIPNNWEERRLRFFLEVRVATNFSSNISYFFQGYTNYLGVTPSGTLDESMVFHINSFIKVSRHEKYTPAGLIVQDYVTDSANILDSDSARNPDAPYTPTLLMRPEDIFSGMQSARISEAYTYLSNQNMNDLRLNLTGSVKSRKSNNVPTSYVARIVDSYNTGMVNSVASQTAKDTYSKARDFTGEGELAQNEFLSELARVKGVNKVSNFTINDLCRIDPNTPNVTSYTNMGSAIHQLHHHGQTEYWTSANLETQIATTLCNSIPALMMELMIQKISFRSTNHDIGGRMTTIIEDALTLNNTIMSNSLEIFKRRFETEIMYDLTHCNDELYTVQILSDLYGDTYITLSLGNSPVVTFNSPSFCDSLLTPVMTYDKNHYDNIIHDFDNLMSNLSQTPITPRFQSII
jgi:hypothetical protein